MSKTIHNKLKQFGGKADQKLIERYEKSKNWHDGKFQNLEKTSMDFSFQELPSMLYKQFFDKKGREPIKNIDLASFSDSFFEQNDKIQLIWFGHSAVLINFRGKIIFIDPMMGSDASPIAPFKTKRFTANTLSVLEKIPKVDLLLMTHDHYDHLDLKSIELLKDKTSAYWVAIGVGRHLESWGIEAQNIKEFDWWDQAKYDDIDITFTPTRHFSGRGLTDRAHGLWGGWVLKQGKESIYFSGDGGYGDHFKEVGQKLGPFDFGLMECGQYNKNWHQIHMYPEESVQAAIDAGVEIATPVHWAGFALAQHPWKEPVMRFQEEAGKKNLKTKYPMPGEVFEIANNQAQESYWWEEWE